MIKKPDGTIYLTEFDGIFDFSGVAIALEKYSVLTETTHTASILEDLIIQTQNTNDFIQGEDVFVKYDGFERKNRISIIGDDKKILLSNRLPVKTGSCSIRRMLKRIKLNNLGVGKYYISPTNELLIIRNSWNNPRITYSEIITAFADVKNLQEEELSLYNDLAISQLYGTLEGLDGLQDALFADEFRNLVILNILSFYSNRFTTIDPEKNFREIYNNAVMNFNIKYKKKENSSGGVTNEINQETQITFKIGF